MCVIHFHFCKVTKGVLFWCGHKQLPIVYVWSRCLFSRTCLYFSSLAYCLVDEVLPQCYVVSKLDQFWINPHCTWSHLVNQMTTHKEVVPEHLYHRNYFRNTKSEILCALHDVFVVRCWTRDEETVKSWNYKHNLPLASLNCNNLLRLCLFAGDLMYVNVAFYHRILAC